MRTRVCMCACVHVCVHVCMSVCALVGVGGRWRLMTNFSACNKIM